MKKGIIIGLVVVLVLVLGGVLFFILGKGKNDIKTVTLDVDLGIEMTLENGKVTEASSIGSDEDGIVTGNIINSDIDTAFEIIVSNLIAKDHIKDGETTAILGTDDKTIEDSLKKTFENHNIIANIVVPTINEQDKLDAENYKISAAKAAYINSIIKENSELRFDDIMNKPSSELNQMQVTGNYCDPGYTLVDDYCEKKVGEEKPTSGKVCPDGYADANGKCYRSSDPIGTEPYCEAGMTLQNNKCVGDVSTTAKGRCETGTYNSNTGKCESLEYIGAATKKCREADDLLLDNGKCAQHHQAGDDGTCCCGDTFRQTPNTNSPTEGWCYSLPDGNYDATLSCSTGTYMTGDNATGCYSTKTSTPTYYCEGNAKLVGDKCIENKSVTPSTRRTCASGYKIYENRICINYDDAEYYTIGLTCGENAILDGEICIVYDRVEARHN